MSRDRILYAVLVAAALALSAVAFVYAGDDNPTQHGIISALLPT